MHNFDFQLNKAKLILSNIKTAVSLFCIFSIVSFCASAQNFTVTSNGDSHAAVPTSGAIDANGFITLRSALEASTQIAGAHIITIPGSITNINLTLGQITVGSAAVGNNITINGPGKAVLTINQTTVNRIFSTGLGAVTFSLNDLTLNYTGPVGTISGGGGAIIAGGVNAVTSLTNVAITNFNIQIGNGGGLSCSTSNINSLTLTNCDFTNNYAGGGGGAVSFNGNATCVITNCRFTNNSTGNLGANTGGSGGALSTTGSGSGGVYTVTNCTFINNHQTTNAQGGAIMNTNGQLNVNHCRFVGNSANIPTNGNVIAQAGGASVQTINAENNWWGSNSGPAANDAVVLAAGGTITLTKWVQLKTSISTNPLCTGAGATVTASFLSNSASEALSTGNIAHLIGLPISFANPTLGSLSGAQATIQNSGTATVTFTAGGTGGTGSVNAIVDNIPNNDVAPAKISFTINGGAAVTGNPSNTAVCAGANASFTASFSGTPTATIQWQVSTNGGASYSNIPGATSSPLTFATVAGDNGKLYRAVGTNTCGSAPTTGALLTVNTAPAVAGNPSNTSVPEGSNASFTASFSGSPAPTLQWQVSTNGGVSYNNIGGATSSPLVFATNLSQSGNLYRCVGTNLCSSVNTTGALLTVTSACAVTGSGTTTPTSCAGGSNGTATITLTGSGSGNAGTYTVDGGGPQPFATNPFTVTGLTAGNHTIVATITPGSGCVSSPIVVNVVGASTFTASFVKTNLSSCSGSPDGSITVTATGGTAPYTYSWSGITGSGNPATTVFPNPGNVASISGLNYGYYNVTITDAGGCGSVTFTNIHVEFAFLVYITNSGSVSSACGNTGSVILYGNAGVTPYTYSLTSAAGPFQSGNTFTNLAAGSYTAYVKDAAGCVSSKPVTVGAAAQIVVSPFARAASSCSPDGSIEVYRTGGIPPYTYSKDGGATYQASNIFTGLAAGPYSIWVKDSKGCTGQANTTVAAGQGLTVTTNKVNTSTCVNDGSIQVNVSGGIAPYTYSKDGGTTYQPGNSFTGLGSGPYSISVKDSKGCLGSAVVTINLNEIIVTAAVTNSSSCASNNGSVQLFRTGGYGPYSYSLDGNTYQSSNLFTGKAPGTYTGYVKDSKTCIGMLANIVVGPDCPPGPQPFARSQSSAGSKINTVTDGKLKIQVYPNPAAESFTLRLQGFSNEKLTVTVTDVFGRKVYQTEGAGKQQYRFGNGFTPGIYNVQVVQGNAKSNLTVVKE